MSRTPDNQPAAPGRSAAATHHPRGTVRGDGLTRSVYQPDAPPPLFAQPLPPVAAHTDPATSHAAAREVEPRRGSQCARILDRLRAGPATNAELAGLALKYTSRLSDLRALGYSIRPTDLGDGLVSYRLWEGRP